MDHELQERIEGLEDLLQSVLKAVQKNTKSIELLRKELHDFKDEQRKQAKKTDALLKQFGARIGSVEDRTSAIESRLNAVEDVVFG